MIPEPNIFYLEFGLFNNIPFEEGEKINAFNVLYYKGTIDAHCPKCEKETVLESIDNYPMVSYDQFGNLKNPYVPAQTGKHLKTSYYGKQKFVLKEFKCTRCSAIHQFHFEVTTLDTNPNTFQIKKVGQCFSIADYQNHDVKKYRKVLGKEMYNEFSKSVGLFSHGVGIGSFVYLRRIIEIFVIQDAYDKESKKDEFNDEVYQKSRIKEKIDLLKNSIPEFLVSNKSLYGILSKGIHELSEKECLEIFPVLKTSIEYILDEIKAKKELEEKKHKLSEQIGKISTSLNNRIEKNE